MKFNGTIFSKPQQDQLKENIGNELEKVSAKVDEVDARMLNYKGNWAEGKKYHENDIVTWNNDGNLYEVIKGHTSSHYIHPNNTEYYKAMTSTNLKIDSFDIGAQSSRERFVDYIKTNIAKIAFIMDNTGDIYKDIKIYTTQYGDIVLMSKIYGEYSEADSNITNVVISTILAKNSAQSPKKRLYTLNSDATITVGDNTNVGGTFKIYSY